MFGISKEVKEVAYLMRNFPDEWKQASEYRIKHEPSGIQIWIGNGLFSLDFHPTPAGLNIREKKHLQKAIKAMIAGRIASGHIRSREAS